MLDVAQQPFVNNFAPAKTYGAALKWKNLRKALLCYPYVGDDGALVTFPSHVDIYHFYCKIPSNTWRKSLRNHRQIDPEKVPNQWKIVLGTMAAPKRDFWVSAASLSIHGPIYGLHFVRKISTNMKNTIKQIC